MRTDDTAAHVLLSSALPPSLPQVCGVLQRPALRTHQDQQQAAVPAPRHHARHPQLRVQRR